jgi:predicted phage terminase large subunit-like protein
MTDLLDAVRLARETSLHRPKSPLAFGQRLDHAYNARPHLAYLSERLAAAVARVEQGESVYLKISMPPRAGKSAMSSIQLPAWILSKHPDWKIGMLSHSPSLASSWGRDVRRLVEERGHELGIELAKDAGAVTEWQTTKRGGVVSRSIGQSVTGLGFKVMILDDIVKDFADAHSELKRQSVWDWWQAAARTRLEPPSLVLAIGTRWHEDDILGRLESKEYGDPAKWEIISFPAIAEENDILGREPGDPLYSPILQETREQALARWADIRTSVGAYAWAALYQQRPAPAGGAIFDTEWWRYWEDAADLPTFEKTITSWDCAFKATTDSDFVVGQRWGVQGPNRYLLEQVRGRWSFTETVKQMEGFIARKSLAWPDSHEHIVEDKANGTAVIDVLHKKIQGMIGVSPTNSKEARAHAVTPQVESGNVYLPRFAPWLNDFLIEHQSFPTGAHDDQVDCTTQALNRLGPYSGPAIVHDEIADEMLGGW